MAGHGLWRSPVEVIFEQMEALHVLLSHPAHARTRARLTALGRDGDALAADLGEIADALLWGIGARDGAEDDLAAERMLAAAVARDAYRWVGQLKERLNATADPEGRVGALRQRLGLGRLRSSRRRSLLDGLRVVLPELRQAALPAGTLAQEPAFVAEAERFVLALDRAEADLDAARRRHRALRREVGVHATRARELGQDLQELLGILGTDGEPVQGLELTVLQAYSARWGDRPIPG